VLALALLASALVGLLSGCTISKDEEMQPRAPRTSLRTQQAAPQRALPERIPVAAGAAGFGPGSRSWARGSLLSVAGRRVDVTPLRVDAWVVVPGGVYFLDGHKLWFTDLSRIRDTGLDDVVRLAATPDGGRVVVRFDGPARPTSYAFGTRSGEPVAPRSLRTVPAHRAAR
jgi:hypothetical protein